MSSTPEIVLDTIKGKPHWRVIFRPTSFDERRIPSVAECWEIINRSRVELRGWDYPHVGRPEEQLTGNDWVGSYSDFWGHWEYWRFFQSAQFYHRFTFLEDRAEQLIEKVRSRNPFAREKDFSGVIDVGATLYSCTEIFEFLSRLVERKIYDDGVEVCIELVGIKNRILDASPPARLMGFYQTSAETITWKSVLSPDTVLGKAPDLALDLQAYIFARFRWKDVPRKAFADEQSKYLGRRIG